MSDELTREVFDHMVRLAALELTEEEAEYLRRQLNNQLKAIHELEAIPLETSVTITSHGVPFPPEISPPPRQDEWLPYPNSDKIIAQAPEEQDGFIVVPETPHTELD